MGMSRGDRKKRGNMLLQEKGVFQMPQVKAEKFEVVHIVDIIPEGKDVQGLVSGMHYLEDSLYIPAGINGDVPGQFTDFLTAHADEIKALVKAGPDNEVMCPQYCECLSYERQGQGGTVTADQYHFRVAPFRAVPEGIKNALPQGCAALRECLHAAGSGNVPEKGMTW